MNFQKVINFLPIIVIGVLGWYSLQTPKTSHKTVLSVPGNSATIQIPNGEPDPDAAASLPEYEVIPGSVHDGDTLRVRSPKGEVLKIRFACVDAPELKQPLGEESRNHLRSIINRGNNKVRVQSITTDRYERTVAQLWNGDGLIQSQMAIAGRAYGYEQYKKDCPN
jgi:endonuclease YncB( thermonuclease family)